MSDAFRLQRFVDAQDPLYANVVAELRAGHKRSHWMWFVFPQIAGLGHSATAQYFAIASRAEAAAYLDHPLLGARLRECTQLVIAVCNRHLEQIFGYPDDRKFHSSMTLFAITAEAERRAEDAALFRAALDKYCAGELDAATVRLLG